MFAASSEGAGSSTWLIASALPRLLASETTSLGQHARLNQRLGARFGGAP